jgi:GT2 family glycosyltransferase
VTLPPHVGVVIVTYNAGQHIGRCLTALAAQTRRPDRIVLVDNASSDGTLEKATIVAGRLSLAIDWVEAGDNIGFAAANNRAVERLSDCEFIATLNPDAFPEPDWLAALVVAAVAHPEAASVASLLLSADHREQLDGAGDVYHVSGLAWRHGHGLPRERVPEADIGRPVFSACAAAALYRRADWINAGGLDERFFCYAEDVDLGFRLQLLGRQCWYEPGAVALHIGGTASGKTSAFAVYHGHRNLEWALLKNMPSSLLRRYLPLHILVSLGSVLWFVAHGQGATIVRAKWDAWQQLRAVLATRREVQATKTVSDAQVLSALNRAALTRRIWRRVRA